MILEMEIPGHAQAPEAPISVKTGEGPVFSPAQGESSGSLDEEVLDEEEETLSVFPTGVRAELRPQWQSGEGGSGSGGPGKRGSGGDGGDGGIGSPGQGGGNKGGNKGGVNTLFSSPPRNGRRFKGVRRRKWGRFVCEIRDAIGKRTWLGSYDTEEEAARVYDMAARIMQGDGAWLNFPNEQPGVVTLPRETVRALLENRGNVVHRLKASSGSSPKVTRSPSTPSAKTRFSAAPDPPALSLPASAPADTSSPPHLMRAASEGIPVAHRQAGPGRTAQVHAHNVLKPYAGPQRTQPVQLPAQGTAHHQGDQGWPAGGGQMNGHQGLGSTSGTQQGTPPVPPLGSLANPPTPAQVEALTVAAALLVQAGVSLVYQAQAHVQSQGQGQGKGQAQAPEAREGLEAGPGLGWQRILEDLAGLAQAGSNEPAVAQSGSNDHAMAMRDPSVEAPSAMDVVMVKTEPDSKDGQGGAPEGSGPTPAATAATAATVTTEQTEGNESMLEDSSWSPSCLWIHDDLGTVEIRANHD